MSTPECAHCGRKFSTHAQLVFHINSPIPGWQDSCNICNQPIPLCSNEAAHKLLHPVCQHCSEVFISQPKLIIHIIQFHQEAIPPRLYIPQSYGNVSCFLCGMTFTEVALVDIHLKITHTILRALFNKYD